jgi:hypothetical protein
VGLLHIILLPKSREDIAKLKENLKSNECILQGDYSQNYSMTMQDATQGMFCNASSQE